MIYKQCRKCGEVKNSALFSKDARNHDGLYSYCRSCTAKARMTYYWKQRDVEIARHAAWLKENAEHCRIWRLLNREKIYVNGARYREVNIARVRAAYSVRRAIKKRAITLWANPIKIQEIYDLALRLTEETGIVHEVDHIVPLQSKIVQGLHCEANLQVIPRIENRTKGNRHWPNMPTF